MNNIYIEKGFVTTNWAGGKTTELFIYPLNSSLKDRNFSFRLSTASVEIEESIFSALPDVKRTLMVLEGEMQLTHLNHHSKALKKFEADAFEGGWETHSKGKCTDFNLMTRGNTSGILEAIILKSDEEVCYDFIDQNKMYFIYLVKGAIIINSKNDSESLLKGDLMLVSDFGTTIIKANEHSEYISIEISF